MLLCEAFGDIFGDRVFFKQIPHERLVLKGADGIDLCVRKSLRGRGLGERLLREVIAAAKRRQVDHVLLVAQDGRLYERVGFAPLTTHVTWLAIHELRSVAVKRETLTGELYTLPIRALEPLRSRELDLLGYLF